MRHFRALLIAAASLLAPMAPATAAEDVVAVYDASGSMWGQIDGVSKIEIAREVGFDLDDETHRSLACIAENTAGVFVAAQNATGLKDAPARYLDVSARKVLGRAIVEAQ